MTAVLVLVLAAAGTAAAPTLVPRAASRLPPTVGLAGGAELPSAVTYGWGSDDWGQLGVDTSGEGTPTPVDQPAPVDVAAGTQYTSMAAGGAHTLGLTTTGQVEAWGSNRQGQLGDGSTDDADVPVSVAAPGGTVFSAVAAGSSHSLALTTTGQVLAWGSDVFGQLGDGSTDDSDVPEPVSAPPGVTFVAIAAGGDHSLALSSAGDVYAWGANFAGQLGDGTTTSSDVPVQADTATGTDFVAIAAGTSFSLALTATGQVESWGFNGSGELGDGSDTSSTTPTAVSVPSGVTVRAIAAGADHALALSSMGAVYDWGSDVFGQLATALVDSAPVDSPIPVQPLGLPPLATFVAVAGGLDSSYALTSTGVVWTWGGDPDGQLGSGPPGVNGVTPAALDSVPGGTLATRIDSGPDASAAFLVTRADQQVTFPQIPTPTYGDPPLDLSPSTNSGLPVVASGTGACSGPADHLALVAAGVCTVDASEAGDFDYYPVSASVSFTVAPATISVVPADATGTAGSPVPSIGYQLAGFVNHDPPSVVSGQASCVTTATTTSPPGTYPITCTTGTLQAANYVFVVAAGATLSLAAAPSGYDVVGPDGSVWALGPARVDSAPAPAFYGSMSGRPLHAPVVGAAFTPLHGGYWLVASDGGVFSFGDAGYYGSTGGMVLNRPVVGMAPTPDGGGYWLVASDGGVFAFGDAGYDGSTGGLDIGQPVVGMAADPSGQGYWLTTATGAVFPFGQATFEGSLRFLDLGFPIVGIAASSDGKGYWLVA
ncbi:MAG TPA: MBG domain-containing protein, partial [Acidimicrobiales bacterium]|nr:MBG domain-containing protein [Acidimicrobiales bacterium]